MRRHRRALLAVTVVLIAGSACGTSGTGGSSATTSGSRGTTGTTAGPGSPGFNEPTDPFYVAPNPLPAGKPGDIIRKEQHGVPAPNGGKGYRVLYHSTGLNGEDIAVSGAIYVPAGDAPAGGRPILSWAHGTTGVVDACAPSLQKNFYTQFAGIEPMYDAGFVVALTDYQGLGTAGVHPYLVGESEGKGVLDIARAARNLDDAKASNKLLLSGHSQGGQASLFAGQLQPTYAGDLQLVGVSAMAPAAELATLLKDQEKTAIGVVLGSYAMNAYHDVYGPTTPGTTLDRILTPEGQKVVPELVPLCLDSTTQEEEIAKIALPATGKFMIGDPATIAPWNNLLQQNTPGQVKTNAPMFIAQGEKDDVVIPATTQTLVKNLCANGSVVKFQQYPGATHTTVPAQSINDVLSWMNNLLKGQPAPDTCASTTAGSAPGSTR